MSETPKPLDDAELERRGWTLIDVIGTPGHTYYQHEAFGRRFHIDTTVAAIEAYKDSSLSALRAKLAAAEQNIETQNRETIAFAKTMHATIVKLEQEAARLREFWEAYKTWDNCICTGCQKLDVGYDCPTMDAMFDAANQIAFPSGGAALASGTDSERTPLDSGAGTVRVTRLEIGNDVSEQASALSSSSKAGIPAERPVDDPERTDPPVLHVRPPAAEPPGREPLIRGSGAEGGRRSEQRGDDGRASQAPGVKGRGSAGSAVEGVTAPGPRLQTCPECEGKGARLLRSGNGNRLVSLWCRHCEGSGTMPAEAGEGEKSCPGGSGSDSDSQQASSPASSSRSSSSAKSDPASDPTAIVELVERIVAELVTAYPSSRKWLIGRTGDFITVDSNCGTLRDLRGAVASVALACVEAVLAERGKD